MEIDRGYESQTIPHTVTEYIQRHSEWYTRNQQEMQSNGFKTWTLIYKLPRINITYSPQ